MVLVLVLVLVLTPSAITVYSVFEPTAGNRYGVSTFNEILSRLASGLEVESIEKLYVILFEEKEDGRVAKDIQESMNLMKVEISSKIEIVPLHYSEVNNWASEIVI